MSWTHRIIVATVALMVWIGGCQGCLPVIGAQDRSPGDAAIFLPDDIEDTMRREAARVRDEFHQQARSLFERRPLGWDRRTIDVIYDWILTLPMQVPVFMGHVVEQGRLLGLVGSLMVLAFIGAALYSLIGQRRVLVFVEEAAQPLRTLMPTAIDPYLVSILKILVASLIPLLLWGAFGLISAIIVYRAVWFLLVGRLLKVWAIGALLLNLLRESLTQDLFSVTARYGPQVFRLARIVVLYILVGIGVLWGAEAFAIPSDVLAFLKFILSLSIVGLLFLLLLKKRAFLSFLPEMPYGSYRRFLDGFERYYFAAIFITFLSGLLWCFGYQRLCRVLWIKTWAVAGTFVGLILFYHLVEGGLQKWSRRMTPSDEHGQFLIKSLKNLLLYVTATTTVLLTMHLLGLLDPLQRLLSFPVLKIGLTQLSVWIMIKAVLWLLAFVYLSGLLRASLDYRVYPTLGIDTGLAYALNTFLNYLILGVGFLISLKVVGIDLRILMVFAGVIGIGIGLGLQNLAANLISGFTIVFGRKLRKDDWIQVGDTRGVVTDIYLRATKVRTRDNVEYLIPNAEFISKTVVNYTLTSPSVRIHIPVGVSYTADPNRVRDILLAAAAEHPEALRHNPPEVHFTQYGDSAIHFDLLVWVDIREIEEQRLRSLLYFTIFERLRQAGIEIPFPQRDLHIRSGWVAPEPPRRPLGEQ